METYNVEHVTIEPIDNGFLVDVGRNLSKEGGTKEWHNDRYYRENLEEAMELLKNIF